MPHTLSEHALPGIDARRLQQLTTGGLDTLEAVVEAGPVRLAELTDFDLKTCRSLVRIAEAILLERDPTVIALERGHDEPRSVRLGLGLSAARRIEHSLSLVRKARSNAAAERKRWISAHQRARRQLRRLAVVLEETQQDVLASGVSAPELGAIEVTLDCFDADLAPLLELPARKRLFKQLRRLAKRTRRAF